MTEIEKDLDIWAEFLVNVKDVPRDSETVTTMRKAADEIKRLREALAEAFDLITDANISDAEADGLAKVNRAWNIMGKALEASK